MAEAKQGPIKDPYKERCKTSEKDGLYVTTEPDERIVEPPKGSLAYIDTVKARKGGEVESATMDPKEVADPYKKSPNTI